MISLLVHFFPIDVKIASNSFASAKIKYPEWDRVISEFFGRIMKDWKQ